MRTWDMGIGSLSLVENSRDMKSVTEREELVGACREQSSEEIWGHGNV